MQYQGFHGLFSDKHEYENMLPSNRFNKKTGTCKTNQLSKNNNAKINSAIQEGCIDVDVDEDADAELTKKINLKGGDNLPKFDSSATAFKSLKKFYNDESACSVTLKNDISFNKEKTEESSAKIYIFDKTFNSSCSSSKLEKTIFSDTKDISHLEEISNSTEEITQKLNQDLIPNQSRKVNDGFKEGFSKKNTLYIPLDKIDDERYKLLQIKNVRKCKYKDNKSVVKSDLYTEKNLQNLDYLGKIKKKSHSAKRTYISEISFNDPLTSRKKNFNIYKDSDIGFTETYSQLIKESIDDEDVPSEDEMISLATSVTLRNIGEAIALVNGLNASKINNINIRDL